MADGKRIMKNTMFLYIRMLLVMGVTLFTSRVILDKLGIDDYGLYNVVGGVVGMLSFLTGTLSIGTSRFITFELGTGNTDKLTRTFSTAFYTHFILGVIIFLFMETVGLWFLYNKLVIPEPRFYACLWVFQISILTTFVSVTQVPYTSVIMAHERMGVYAYVSIFEVMAKLAVCYLISYSSFDRLIYYAVLIAVVQVIVASIYRIYCVRKFKESLLSKIFDKSIFRKMLGFSGWNIMANLSETFNQQGVLIMLNLFFTPAVVAAQAISVQVSNALMQFVNNFRTAIN
ncbi:MAG: polysaccharide biosynthesis protein, partial [Paludibacteraceae bacterium]|nr:polysaccharide biosynthesis protein [Paludibacteraceae bacterium]